MKTVLGVETATRWTAVGLSQGDEILAERSVWTRGGHASNLPELVSEVLEAARRSPDAFDCIAVSIGPGSFTGLRVGLGFAKGLALARAVPVVSVGTLSAMALAAETEGRIACCLDARKQEVYIAIFEVQEGRVAQVRLEPRALSPTEAAIRLRAEEAISLVVGDGPERYPELAEGRRWRPLDDRCPSGGRVAVLGGQSSAWPATPLVPFYARASASGASLTEK